MREDAPASNPLRLVGRLGFEMHAATWLGCPCNAHSSAKISKRREKGREGEARRRESKRGEALCAYPVVKNGFCNRTKLHCLHTLD